MLSSKYLINILVCLMWYSQCKKSENQAARFQFYIVFSMVTKPVMCFIVDYGLIEWGLYLQIDSKFRYSD